MTTENTNFDEMTETALANVDEAIDNDREKQGVANPYKLTEALLEDGNMFDETGAYFHFKEYFQTSRTPRKHENKRRHIFVDC